MSNHTVKSFIEAQNSLVIQHSDFSLKALYDMASNESIDLSPHYQRRDRWSTERQSALIESFILNVPVPPVYLSEDDFGKYSVIDGKQRITAIRDFLSGNLPLIGLKRFHDLEGKRFDELPTELKNALSVRPYLRVIILLRQTDPLLKYEVFLRLNTGGERLLAMEIRNVAFSGPLNDLLFELSSNEFLRDRLKIKDSASTAFKNMDDVEHVLRFFTLSEEWRKIRPMLGEAMDDYMRENRFINRVACKALKDKFEFCIDACRRIFGVYAFFKPQHDGWRSQFISPLYDAEMVAASQFNEQEIDRIVKHREKIMESLRSVFFEDEMFSKSVSQSTNNSSAVKKRISTVYEVFLPFSEA